MKIGTVGSSVNIFILHWSSLFLFFCLSVTIFCGHFCLCFYISVFLFLPWFSFPHSPSFLSFCLFPSFLPPFFLTVCVPFGLPLYLSASYFLCTSVSLSIFLCAFISVFSMPLLECISYFCQCCYMRAPCLS